MDFKLLWKAITSYYNWENLKDFFTIVFAVLVFAIILFSLSWVVITIVEIVGAFLFAVDPDVAVAWFMLTFIGIVILAWTYDIVIDPIVWEYSRLKREKERKQDEG